MGNKKTTKNTSEEREDFKTPLGEVEKLLDYEFKDITLLEKALTHPSMDGYVSYNRLAFLGDAALNHVFTKYFYFTYPDLNSASLTDLRKETISDEKMARVAVRHRLYPYIRRRSVDDLDQKWPLVLYISMPWSNSSWMVLSLLLKCCCYNSSLLLQLAPAMLR